MKPVRLLAVGLSASSLALGLWACVGDEPVVAGSGNDASSDSPTSDGASSTTEGGGSDAGIGDAADDGPRCDPAKAFNDVERLKGISTTDDERGVWVSADELTAYVAVTPAQGSDSRITKSTRASRNVDFSAPQDDPQLGVINAQGGITAPSLTADGLVLAYSRSDGVYISVRGAVTEAFPVGTRAKSRDNDITSGEAFLHSGGVSLLLARDNGANGYEIDEALRDVGMIYGDGGFLWYSVAPGVTNVNDDVADDRRPVYSSDRLTFVFASNRAPGANANTDLYIAQRAGTGGTFTSPTRMAEPISSTSSDLPGSLSEDGCVLYFTSDRAGGFGEHDVYVAKRPK
ncbi:MAG: OmpA family protein [Labilithrix sp.]|nr:OmpA family protein [Labilithrix sp.]